MRMTWINNGLLAVAISVAMSGYGHAQSPEVLNPPIKSATKKKAKRSSGSKAKFISGSGETTKERDSRLKRECKGQVNAGACAGYTR